MKPFVPNFLLLLLFMVMLSFSVITSCNSDKSFRIEGTVHEVVNGKDGYTATLVGNDGKSFDAVISRTDLGDNYKVLVPGDRVALTGDTMHLDNKLHIKVSKIN